MERLLLLVGALALVFVGHIQASDQLSFCQGKICPEFTIVDSSGSFEERRYAQSKWMRSRIHGTSAGEVMASASRLKAFREDQSRALGVELSDNTWPGLISVEQTDGGEVYWMMWMISPDGKISDGTYGEVEVVTFPEASIYVRSFGGTPSIDGGRQNANALKGDLENAGKSFNKNLFYGASYESYFSFTHHNEIWIPKA